MRLRRLRSTAAISYLLTFTLLAGVLVGIVLFTVRLIERDQAQLAQRLAQEQLAQLSSIAHQIELELSMTLRDLQSLGSLLNKARSASEAELLLSAYLQANPVYCGALLRESHGHRWLEAWTDDLPPWSYPRLRQAMQTASENVLKTVLQRGKPLATLEVTPGSAYRAFAASLSPSDGMKPQQTVALLVDVVSLLKKLRLLSSPLTRLLILGPDGQPLPLSSAALIGRLHRPGSGAFREVIRMMRFGGQGSQLIRQEEAARLGLGRGHVIAVYAPIRLAQGSHWSAAAFSLTSALGDHEQQINWHLGMVSLAAVLGLIIFGSYVVISSRQAAVMSERLRYTEELTQLHKQAEKILETIPTGVLVLSEKDEVTSLNRALRSKLPITAVGASLKQAFPRASTSSLQSLRGLVQGAVAKGRTCSLLGQRLQLFGDEGQYSLHAVPLEPHSPEARLFLFLDDLSMAGSLEKRLLQAEKQATVGILAAGMAHEVGTPLGVVRGRAEYLLGKLTDHPQASSLQVIIEQIDRITRTVQEVLSFSRTEQAAVAPVLPRTVVDKAVALLGYEFTRRGIELQISVPADLPPMAANADQLQQILINLMINACDAIGEGGGAVRVEAAYAEEEIAQSSWDHIRLEVSDNGCGIPDEQVHRVFDPFYTTKKRGKGTGLGLTIVSQIVRSHGALIDLRSEPGQGTQVTLLWPVSNQPQGARHAS